MNRERYTLEFKIRVSKDRRSGMPLKEVAEKYGIAESTVYKWTRLYYSGRLYQEETYTKEERNAAVMQYVWGKTKKKISGETGVPLQMLNEWIDQYFYEEAQERQEIIAEKEKSIFRERKHRDKNGNLLRTVYPSSSAAYVTWAK